MSQSQNSRTDQESPGQYLGNLGAKFRETGFDADEITLAGVVVMAVATLVAGLMSAFRFLLRWSSEL
jgi:hypothetical protein